MRLVSLLPYTYHCCVPFGPVQSQLITGGKFTGPLVKSVVPVSGVPILSKLEQSLGSDMKNNKSLSCLQGYSKRLAH